MRGCTAADSPCTRCSPRASSRPSASRRRCRARSRGNRSSRSASCHTASICSTGRSSFGSRPSAPASRRRRSSSYAWRSRPRSRMRRTSCSNSQSWSAGVCAARAARLTTPLVAGALVIALVVVTWSPPQPQIVFAALGTQEPVVATTPPPSPARARPRRTAARARDRVHRVLVVGDSVGLTLGRGIELWARSTGAQVLTTRASTARSDGGSRSSKA